MWRLTVLVAVVAVLRIESAAAECVIRFENGTGLPSLGLTYFSINEDDPQGTILANLAIDDPSYVLSFSCLSSANCFVDIVNIGPARYDLVLEKAIGDDYDNGVINEPLLTGRLDLVCPGSSTNFVESYVLTVIRPTNTHRPEFSGQSIEIALEESIPVGLDFSQYFSGLYVTDFDRTSAKIAFSIDSNDFQLLEPLEKIDCSTGKITYYPRLAAKNPLYQAKKVHAFSLTASDQDNSPLFSSIPVKITISAADNKDPEFVYPVYTAFLEETEYIGILNLTEDDYIQAVDGDSEIAATIVYNVKDNGGANVEIIENNGKIQLNLIEPLDERLIDKKLLVVVVEAWQESDISRRSSVGVVVHLPQPVVATTSTTEITTTACPTESPVTTVTPEPCVCPTTTEAPECPTTVVVTTTECPICPTTTTTIVECPTTSTTAECPVCPATTTTIVDCPTTATTTECPVCPTTTNPETTTTVIYYPTTPTTTECPVCPTTTCPETTTIIADCPTSPSTTECPVCPTTTCPETTTATMDCPTSPATTECPISPETTPTTCEPCACSTTTTTANVGTTQATPTQCPLTCPPCSTATTSPSTTTKSPTTGSSTTTFRSTTEGNTTIHDTPTTVNYCTPCPTTPEVSTTTFSTVTTSKPTTVVTFTRSHYSADVVERNTDAVVLTVAATTSNGQRPTYSLDLSGNNIGKFTIDESTGVITVVGMLYAGDEFQFGVVAVVASGESDIATVSIFVVSGLELCGQLRFDRPLYEVSKAENSSEFIITAVSLVNSNGHENLAIAEVQPSSCKSEFYITGSTVFVRKALERRLVSEIWLTIVVENIDMVSTIVHITVIDVNEPPKFDYRLPLVIGYPRRTYFDYTVDMPLFTFRATDNDFDVNSQLVYTLNDSSNFYVDSVEGNLYSRDFSSCLSDSCELEIRVTDGGGLSAKLAFTVVALYDSEISVLNIQGLSNLSADYVTTEMSRILGYSVYPMHLSSTETSKRTDHKFGLSVFAVDTQGKVLERSRLSGDVQKADFSEVSWILDKDNVMEPPEYQPKALEESNQSLTIATGCLGAILGVVLLGGLAFFSLKQKQKKSKKKQSQQRSIE